MKTTIEIDAEQMSLLDTILEKEIARTLEDSKVIRGEDGDRFFNDLADRAEERARKLKVLRNDIRGRFNLSFV